MPVEFRLGTFSVTKGARYPGLVVGERAVAFSSVDSFLSRTGKGVNGADSVLALLNDWEHNFAALQRAAQALAEGSAPELAREAVATVGNAERPMHENFDRHLCSLRDPFDLAQRQFAGENHPFDADLLHELDPARLG